ncbi:uncharacterized protein LOC110956017 [Acanthochromis polyacanthus]|uniref:uncharacterized protein LOC110956017 n=1 Tax=Acanthochromis polyacanthus TaxID=80966 RepID=UPI0022348339|nr:uncharacterized protein LOC110956017 [Acanthochromis polyacanthus]
MKTSLAGLLIFIQLCEAGAELVFERLMEGQTLVLFCSPQKDHGSPSGLHLYHRRAQSQTTLLSLSEAGEVRVDPEVRTRLQLRGGLDALNVTISQVQLSDTGLYMWELSYQENSSDQSILSPHKVFLLVEGRSCRCSQSYPPLLWTIFTAAGLLLVMLSTLAIDKCVKTRPRHRPQPHVPIYEEMSWKQQSPGSPPSSQEAPSHLEEVSFPVYANPNIRQPQDNYYACPRQLALRA